MYISILYIYNYIYIYLLFRVIFALAPNPFLAPCLTSELIWYFQDTLCLRSSAAISQHAKWKTLSITRWEQSLELVAVQRRAPASLWWQICQHRNSLKWNEPSMHCKLVPNLVLHWKHLKRTVFSRIKQKKPQQYFWILLAYHLQLLTAVSMSTYMGGCSMLSRVLSLPVLQKNDGMCFL